MPDKRFDGNSEELKNYLSRKMYELLRRRDVVSRQAAKDVITRSVDQIEEVLWLSYFTKGPIMTMEELVGAVKKDRNRDIADRDQILQEWNATKERHSKAIERANAIRLADPDANEYNNKELENIKYLNDEFMMLEYELDNVKRDIDTRHQLLGMIHRPHGYFSKADNAV